MDGWQTTEKSAFIKIEKGCPRGQSFLLLRYKWRNTIDFPVTLYNEDVRKLSQPTNKVLAIYTKYYNEQSYNTCAYIAKNLNITLDEFIT